MLVQFGWEVNGRLSAGGCEHHNFCRCIEVSMICTFNKRCGKDRHGELCVMYVCALCKSTCFLLTCCMAIERKRHEKFSL